MSWLQILRVIALIIKVLLEMDPKSPDNPLNGK
jgi:hypothetical protein